MGFSVIDTSGPTSGTNQLSHIAGGKEKGIILACFAGGNDDFPSSLTFDGDSFSIVKHQTGTTRKARIYGLVNPSTGTFNIIPIDNEYTYSAISVKNVKSLRGTGGHNASTGNASITIATLPGDLVVAGLGMRSSAPTGVNEGISIALTSRYGFAYIKATTTSTTITFASPAADHAIAVAAYETYTTTRGAPIFF